MIEDEDTVMDSVPGHPRPAARVGNIARRLRGRVNEAGLFGAGALLFIALSISVPPFLTTANLLNVLRDAAFVGMIAWGMTLVLVGGEIDISPGPAVAFGGVLLAVLNTTMGVPLPIAAAAVLLMGTLLGIGAGAIRAYLNVPTFITTLTLWLALRGAAQLLSDALPIPIANTDFQVLGNGSVFGVPVPVIFMIAGFGFFWFVSARTSFGRSIYAVGGNAEAARLSGIGVAHIRTAILGITGFLSAFTGILVAARLGSGNSGAADGLEFDVIAAVIVGGTSLSGGRGTLLGTALGVLFIAELGNGLILIGVTPYVQSIIRGVVILTAVIINVLVRRD